MHQNGDTASTLNIGQTSPRALEPVSVVRWQPRRIFFIASATSSLLFALLLGLPLWLGCLAAGRGQQAMVLVQAGDQTQAPLAVAAFEQSLHWLPDDIALIRRLAVAYTLNGNPEAAVRALERAAMLEPTNTRLLVDLGYAYERFAMSEAQAALPGGDTSMMQLADALLSDRRAASVWRSAGLTADSFTLQAHAALDRGDQREASVWYQRAVAIQPSLGDSWYDLALIAQSQQQWQVALALYERALAAPDHGAFRASDILLQQGLIYQNPAALKDPSAALGLYARALAEDSFSRPELRAEAYYKSGEIYIWWQAPAVAADSLRQAVAILPRHHWAQLRLAQALEQNGQMAEAQAAIGRAIDLWPNDRYQKLPHRVLGDILRETGQVAAALKVYQYVLTLDPVDADVVQIVGRLQLQAQEP